MREQYLFFNNFVFLEPFLKMVFLKYKLNLVVHISWNGHHNAFATLCNLAFSIFKEQSDTSLKLWWA